MSISVVTNIVSKVGRIPRSWVVLVVLAIAVLFIFLSLISRDNRSLIAQALLYDPPMELSQYEKRIDPVFSGALAGKFPPGTEASKLLSFVSSLGGWCVKYPEDKPPPHTHSCSVVIESEAFSSIDLQIEAKIRQGKVVELQAIKTHEFY